MGKFKNIGKVPYSLAGRKSQFSATPNVVKFYATLQSNGTVNLSQLAEHMVEHGSKYDEGDILAILTNCVACVKEMLLMGYKVEFGKLGTFSNSIKSTGADSASNFTANNITRLRARFSPSEDLKNYRSEAQFEYVPIRANQALLLSAEKGGAEVMNLHQTESGNGGGGNGGGGNGEDEDPEDITEE